jgi:phage FluMu protein Com
MKMRCPHCGLGGEADTGRYAKKVRCPGCRAVFRVTDDVIAEPSSAGAFQQSIINDDPIQTTTSETGKTGERGTDDRTLVNGHGLGECSRCGFSFSSDFLTIIDDLPVCPACAG